MENINNSQNFNKENHGITPVGIISVIIFLLLAFMIVFSINKNNHRRIDELKSDIVLNNPFDSIELEAKAAIVWDINNGRSLFEHESKTRLPLASLTKLVTAAVALESTPKYTVIPINADALSMEGDTGLLLGERWSIGDLVRMTLVSSSNDGARALASTIGAILKKDQNSALPITDKPNSSADNELAFIGEMNNFIEKIGLQNSDFKNEHGLDLSKEESGGYGSARDVAILFSYLIKKYPDILDSTAMSGIALHSYDGVVHNLKNTNKVVDLMPGLLASKTGFTDLSGGNVAVVTSPGIEGPFVTVVLGSSYSGRFLDLEKLSRATLEYLEKNR